MVTEKQEEKRTGGANWLALTPEQGLALLWKGRFHLFFITTLFTLIGIGVALLATPEYASEVRIMPEMNHGSVNMFRRLVSVAGFSGIDLGNSQDIEAVRPDLYPTVLQSTPFILYVLAQAVPTTDGKQKTVAMLLRESDGSGLSRWFSSTHKPAVTLRRINPKTIQLTQEQQQLLELIQKRISTKMDTRTGIISISAQLPDPVAVAAVAQLSLDYLTQYVTNYRTEKARKDLAFYTHRLAEAKRRYQTAQYNVFQYTDQHKYMVVQAATMERQRLEAELAIAQTLYTELSEQYEQARIRVQEETPVFKVLEPAKIPLKRVSPRRSLMVIVATGTGFVLGSLYLLITGSGVLENVRQQIRAATAASH